MTMTTDTTNTIMTRITVNGAALRRAVQAVTPAASTDEARGVLCGVLIESEFEPGGSDGRIRLTATDSYRLHTATVAASVPIDGPMVVRADELTAAAKATKRQSTVELMSRGINLMVGPSCAHRIDGDYPNWQQLMPAWSTNNVTWTPTAAQVRALEPGIRTMQARSQAVGWDIVTHKAIEKPWRTRESEREAYRDARDSGRILVHIGAGTGRVPVMQLRCDHKGREVEELSLGVALVTGDQDALPVNLDADYLLDALDAVGPEAQVGIRDGLKAVMIVGGDNIQALVMPVRT